MDYLAIDELHLDINIKWTNEPLQSTVTWVTVKGVICQGVRHLSGRHPSHICQGISQGINQSICQSVC